MSSGVLERSVVAGENRPSQFEGTVIKPGSLGGELGMNAEQAKRWTTFMCAQPAPRMLFCPIHQTRFGNGQGLVLIWYRDGEGAEFELRFARPLDRIPSEMLDLEVYQGNGKSSQLWLQRLLDAIKTGANTDPNPGLDSSQNSYRRRRESIPNRTQSDGFGKPPKRRLPR